MKDVKKFFAQNYSKCWEFSLECKWFFVFAFAVFALTFLIGFAYPVFFREEIFEMVKMLMLQVEELGTLNLIAFIFFNNLKASFMAMVLGIGLGVLPLVTCIVNGYLLGFVAREAVVLDGLLTMWRILPHGVFELPAIIFSIGIGMRLGLSIFEKKKNIGAGYVFREGFRFFVFVVFPLLVVAGIIEGVLIGIGI